MIAAERRRTLSADEEQELARRMAAGRSPDADEATRADATAARAELIESNQGSAMAVAKKVGGRLKMPIDDAFGCALLGMIRAADYYRPRGIRFSTYAYRIMCRFVADHWQATNFAVPMRPEHAAIYLRLREGKPPKGRLSDRQAERIVRMGTLTFGGRNLAGEEWDEPIAPGGPDPADVEERDIDLGRMGRAIGRLGERYREVLERFYGLEGQEPETLEAIGVSRGVSKERIRQLRDEGIRRLRISMGVN